MARLGDICMFQSGGTPSRKKLEYFNGDIPWVTTTALNGNVIEAGDANEWITIKAIEESAAKLVPAHSILVGTRVGVGKVAINLVPISTSQDIITLVGIDENKWCLEYICKFLLSKSAYLNSQARGATIKGIKIDTLAKLELPDIAIPEQRIIALIIENTEKIISLRKQQLSKLDEFVKSRFIEMFGDPIKNTQNRPTTAFINVVKLQRGYDLPVQDRQRDGSIPVYGSNGVLDRHNVAKVRGGGVITGRSGTIGQVFYCESDYWPLNTSLFSVDTHGNNIIYLAYLLQMYDLSRFTEGTGVPTLNRNKFHNKPIIDVPLELQKQFAAFVEQTDKTKLQIKQSLEKLEILKKSLMQKYFG